MNRQIFTTVNLLIISAVVAAPADSRAASRRLQDILPRETTAALFVEDVPALRARWPDLPLVKVWNDPSMQKFLAPLLELTTSETHDTKFLSGDDLQDLDDFLALVTGQLAMMLPDIEALAAALEDNGDDDDGAAFAILAHVGGNASKVAELLRTQDARDLQESAEADRMVDEEFMGETLHIKQLVTGDTATDVHGWSVVDGIAVMATPKSLLQQLVAAVKGTDDGLSTLGTWETTRRRTDDSTMHLFVNLKPLVAWAQRLAEEADAEAQPNPMGLTPAAMFRGLGLDVLEAGYASVGLSSTVTRLDYGVLFSGNRGLVKLFTFGQPGDPPALVPERAVQGGYSAFSISGFWTGLREMLRDMSPMLGAMVDGQMQQLSAQLGVDLEKSIIGSLGDTMASASFFDTPDTPGQRPKLEELSQVVAISLNDRQSLEMAVQTVLANFLQGTEPFERREFLGTEIQVLKQPLPMGPGGEPRTAAYALTDKYLLVALGSVEPLQEVLTQLQQPRRSLWTRPDVKRSMEALPGGAVAWGYSDSAAMLTGAVETLIGLQTGMQQGLEQQQPDAEEQPPSIVNPDARPDPELFRRYFSSVVSGFYKTDREVRVAYRLLHSGP